ncbi:MAG: hypothetical protein KAI08_10455 [Bacteroidales bacterium]|nr:hypothetical protein [Bacteroidales bacterium]
MRTDMQNRRPILVLIVVIPAVLLLILLAGPWKLLQRDSTNIALRNMEEVDRIVLVDSYNTTELNRSDSTWYLFTSEAVSPVAVENLLFTASRLEAASIVGLEVFEESPDTQGDVREITFFRGRKVLLSCRLKTQSGQYLLHPNGSEKAYYVSLPGYPGLEIDRIFSATPDHYREHLLIDLPPSDISSIEFDLASGEAFHFTQDMEGQIACNTDNDYTILPDGIPNELAMKLLFSYFTSIRFEQRAGIPADSLLGAEAIERKLASVRVTSFSGEQHSMQVFSYHDTPGSKPHLFRALVLYNDEQDALFVNYIYLDVLMRGLSHYFGEK